MKCGLNPCIAMDREAAIYDVRTQGGEGRQSKRSLTVFVSESVSYKKYTIFAVIVNESPGKGDTAVRFKRSNHVLPVQWWF